MGNFGVRTSLYAWIKKAFSKIGPYPYNPYLIFLLFYSLQFSRFAPLILEEPRGLERYRAAFFIFLLAIPPALIFSVLSYLFGKYRIWSSESLLIYILEVAFAQSFQFLYYPISRPILTDRFHYDFPPALTVSPGMFIGSLILALFGLYVMHRAERVIMQRLDAATSLVEQLKIDRQDLVNRDEEIRRKTAQFLHDRLQSDLFLAGMKLKTIAGTSTAEGNEIIEKIIARLENSRSKDLRNLIEVLTPNFESAGLEGAFEALLIQYDSDIDITLDIDDASEMLDDHSMLGIYRIAEQALLNTLAHGPAKRAKIEVSTSTTGTTQVLISDDGPGVALEKTKPGVGSAIIDSWVELLNATKSIDTAPGHGFRLHISFSKG